MSLPKYIVNLDECNIDLNDAEIVVEFPDDLKNMLDGYMKQIVEMLEHLLGKKSNGYVQKVIGLHEYIPALNFDFKTIHTFEEDVILTGVTYSQTGWKVCDTWDLYVNDKLLFENVYTKELGEYKHFNAFCMVKAGEEVKFIHHNISGNSKQIWWDIHYLGLEPDLAVPDPNPEVSHEYDYLIRITWQNAHRFGAGWISGDYKDILLNNFGDTDHFNTEEGSVWVDESYGMDGEAYEGEALYSLQGKINEKIYFAIQRCPYCDECDYIKITIENRKGEVEYMTEISYPDTMDIIRCRDNVLPDYSIVEQPKDRYTPIFEFGFIDKDVKITPLWT